LSLKVIISVFPLDLVICFENSSFYFAIMG
jgi:hypothetical protein